jgi:hypothetical protein
MKRRAFLAAAAAPLLPSELVAVGPVGFTTLMPSVGGAPIWSADIYESDLGTLARDLPRTVMVETDFGSLTVVPSYGVEAPTEQELWDAMDKVLHAGYSPKQLAPLVYKKLS